MNHGNWFSWKNTSKNTSFKKYFQEAPIFMCRVLILLLVCNVECQKNEIDGLLCANMSKCQKLKSLK
jgi:hypothetical protein